MNQIEVEGTIYRSVAAAWRAVSPKILKLITVRLRLRNGWDIHHAFLAKPVPPENRRNNKDLRTN
jgi:hypothetical protein